MMLLETIIIPTNGYNHQELTDFADSIVQELKKRELHCLEMDFNDNKITLYDIDSKESIVSESIPLFNIGNGLNVEYLEKLIDEHLANKGYENYHDIKTFLDEQNIKYKHQISLMSE